MQAAASDLRDGGAAADRLSLERPKKAGFGDYSTNAAMLLAPALGEPPRAVAERLGAALQQRLGGRRREGRGRRARVPEPVPGRRLVPRAPSTRCSPRATRFGAGDEGERVQVEFVSANPTGPLTAASGRHAAFGDALARILELAGNTVQREYYFNDGGGQVQRLGASILARARGEEPPEDGYQGDYVAALAAQIPDAAGAGRARAGGAPAWRSSWRGSATTLERYRVHFDRWFCEATALRGRAERLGPRAREARGRRATPTGTTARCGCAPRSSPGDEKDRPLVRSTGEPTYLAADVAYHWDKLDRGYDTLVNVLGADHHNYAVRLRAILAAAGADPDRLVVPLLQFVHVVEGGERASMSKRRGDFVTLEELIDEIGVDATRFFMLSRSARLDRRPGPDPGARAVRREPRVLRAVRPRADRVGAAQGGRGARRRGARRAPRGLVLEPAERELVKKLLAFPAEVAEAAERRAPHRIAVYALETAQAFTAFYRDCRVVGAEPEGLESFRIALSVAAQRIIARSLALLGVAAPASM